MFIQYVHFRGVEDTLERLVEQRTKGQYKLFLGETRYDFVRLDFILKDARIYRIDTLNKKRVYYVDLPYVEIDLGSLDSYFDFKQITVKEFIIEEPVIVLQKGDSRKQRINLSGELIQVLRMIREILDSFNIHSFKIIKGAFHLSKGDDQLRIKLIDFLAEEWNIRKLSAQSQIQIRLDSQVVDAFNHHFSFKEIEYSYLKRQFRISDFKYHHTDTVSGARLYAQGRAFIVDHIDWNELFRKEQVSLKKIKLINAELQGAFPRSGKKKGNRDLFKMMRDALGELKVDSLLVHHANVRLAYQQAEDSTSVSFQNASFSVSDFKFLNNNEIFEVGQVRFNLNQTVVALGKKWKVRFDSLLYNRHPHQQLAVLGVQLLDGHGREPLLTSGQVILTRFNPYDFLLGKQIKAKSAELNDVEMDILPEVLQIKRSGEKSSLKINFEKLNLNRAKIHYSDKDKKIDVTDLNVLVTGVYVGDGRPVFNFKSASIARINFLSLKEGNKLHAEQLQLRPDSITIQSMQVRQPGPLSFDLSRVKILADSIVLKSPDRIKLLHAEKLTITGNRARSRKPIHFPRLDINQIKLDSIQLNVTSGPHAIHADLLDFDADDIQLDSSVVNWNRLKAGVPALRIDHPQWKAEAKNSQVNSAQPCRLNELTLFRKDSTVAVKAKAFVFFPDKTMKNITGVRLIQADVNIRTRSFLCEGRIDSVLTNQVELLKQPLAGTVQLFHPVLRVEGTGRPAAPKKKKQLALPEIIEALFVHQADITIAQAEAPVRIHGLNAQWRQKSEINFSIDSLRMQNASHRITLRQGEFKDQQLALRELDITPLLAAQNYSHVGLERDWLKLNFKTVQVQGLSMDSVLYGEPFQLKQIEIGSFRIDVLRDKRLPDPPWKEKELFSRKLYCFGKPVDIPLIRFAHGEVYLQQISDKTNEKGVLDITSIAGEIRNVNTLITGDRKPQLEATAQIYTQGQLKVKYEVSELDLFKMEITARDLDLPAFNKILLPLESIRIKSGKVKTLNVIAEANNHRVTGNALINYEKLRVKIEKENRTVFENELISAIANELIRNKRNNVTAAFEEERNRNKAEFTYWVKIAVKGAASAARHGKKNKKMIR